MNEFDLLESIGEIDHKFISSARDTASLKRKKQTFRWSTALACSFVLAGIFFAESVFHPVSEKQPENITAAVPEEDAPVLTDTAVSGNTGVSSVYIPRFEIPESDGMSEADMLPVIVYEGRIYVGRQWYMDGEHKEKLSHLIGRHLGNGSGNLDEYSSQEAYTNEYASNFTYGIYSLAGYDIDFRIAGIAEHEDVNHEPASQIVLLECLNDISLEKGSDLFEDRLHLWERTESVQYHPHNSQSYDLDSASTASIDSEIWDEFADQINHAEFIDINSIGMSSLYYLEHQAHLIVNLDDGCIARLRMIEGGYVGYDALPGYFVRIPGEIFNAVFTACGGITD